MFCCRNPNSRRATISYFGLLHCRKLIKTGIRVSAFVKRYFIRVKTLAIQNWKCRCLLLREKLSVPLEVRSSKMVRLRYYSGEKRS